MILPGPSYGMCLNRMVEHYQLMSGEHANSNNNLVDFIVVQIEKQSSPKNRPSRC
jgi:hypothetical protein